MIGALNSRNPFEYLSLFADATWRLSSVDEPEPILEYDQDVDLPNLTCVFAIVGGSGHSWWQLESNNPSVF
jgi:hypothetical protein